MTKSVLLSLKERGKWSCGSLNISTSLLCIVMQYNHVVRTDKNVFGQKYDNLKVRDCLGTFLGWGGAINLISLLKKNLSSIGIFTGRAVTKLSLLIYIPNYFCIFCQKIILKNAC